MMDDILIKVDNLTLQTRRGFVLENISFEIRKGYVYGVVGSNGAGKTTLLKCVAGMVDNCLGSVFKPDSKIKIGYDIGTYTEIPGLSGKNLLRYFMKMNSCYTEKAVEELLWSVGLEEQGNKLVAKYSMGMKQRLFFAISLIAEPDLLILDEPVSGVDYSANNKIKEKMKEYMENREKSILVSNHNMKELYEMSDIFLFLRKGKLVNIITKQKLLAGHYCDNNIPFEQIQSVFSDFIEESEGKV